MLLEFTSCLEISIAAQLVQSCSLPCPARSSPPIQIDYKWILLAIALLLALIGSWLRALSSNHLRSDAHKTRGDLDKMDQTDAFVRRDVRRYSHGDDESSSTSAFFILLKQRPKVCCDQSCILQSTVKDRPINQVNQQQEN